MAAQEWVGVRCSCCAGMGFVMRKLKNGDVTTCDVCGASGPYSDQPGEGIVHGADGRTMTCDDCAALSCVSDGIHCVRGRCPRPHHAGDGWLNE